MSEMLQTLISGLNQLNLPLSQDTCQRLCAFADAMLEKNQVMNLTAVTDPNQVAKRHLLDSVSVLLAQPLAGKKVIDVGCGAGFPGVPLKIACPEADITLLDSLGKRMTWLEETLPTLGVDTKCVTARAEEYVENCREQYDVATSRAVARLNILLELTAPYVKKGGVVIAMKGTAAQEELQEAKNAISRLGLTLEKNIQPFGEDFSQILVFRKTSHTPPQYPRRYAKIKQQPL